MAQNLYLYKAYEDSLKKFAGIILSGQSDNAKLKANDQFLKTFKSALSQDKAFYYPFDSLITVSKLIAPDNKLKLFTWTIMLDNGNYKYFGFIELNPEYVKNKNKLPGVISLNDRI